MNDPWWLILLKTIVLVVLLLTWTIFNVWFERRLVGKMQHRLGPIMNGPFGLGQALADGMKCLFKEDFIPSMVDRVLFVAAPLIAGTAAFTAWAVIPLGGEVEIFGVKTLLQATDLPVGVLVMLAVTSVAIYGFVLAGWSSNSPYALLGALRSSAQMISYEVAMGLSLVSVFLFTGSMSTHQIVEAQRAALTPFGFNIGLQNWNWLVMLPAFVIYMISMVGETNRAPFDLPEAESELVSGYITEYSGFKYAIYFLAEYINMATVSAIATTLFLGGYLPIYPFNLIEPLNNPWLGPIWFVIKVQLLIAFFVWLRGTLPRFRYDQFMKLGWKVLIPVALAWIVVFATFQALRRTDLLTGPGMYIAIGVMALVVFGVVIIGDKPVPEPPPAPTGVYDAFAGGYPVPPLPGQVLPELSGVVTSTAEVAEPTSERSE
ncbi:NADH-quinone oxidoreductase subunit NuoH [Propionicimonas sp.]|uniref:NADH-quinone oxidoreductase subunit NuoH n=1 Tax=Propionicimonas sp. TaxID=1955623 RepID=UPI00181A6427|nr:NADH-quinone oxidoreductase subunit NuoH [Propionicimonas sp.]MBU3977734.1 NADH-quinone oxidoreductase subunit NuoH [Actinomycetota bacterium]MBA3021657.1 NADH-quinone oxidoreductase subunit NuoH [Propionicimonas sp.]MBU3987208.1 NADH-quinone oxidoreductase subunit NuoH [Actinomycetota bacterium]MBU4009029.1 NADH-quinone oxidoreductase subunit NuoH [Actinomycetota bacterium]MBU4065821.1 NADH-quinone oxidoreductase subunit NuoH [Actinomycetota bacterium]